MKKLLLILICFFLANFACAMQLEGGVKFNVDSARSYVLQGQSQTAEIPGHYRLSLENTERVVYSYNNNGDVIGITVQYVNEPTRGYIYDRHGRLIFMDVYDKPTNQYPHRGYRYKPDGNIFLSTLSVSKEELFRFTPEGELLAHSLNGVIYDENGNKIGTSSER